MQIHTIKVQKHAIVIVHSPSKLRNLRNEIADIFFLNFQVSSIGTIRSVPNNPLLLIHHITELLINLLIGRLHSGKLSLIMPKAIGGEKYIFFLCISRKLDRACLFNRELFRIMQAKLANRLSYHGKVLQSSNISQNLGFQGNLSFIFDFFVGKQAVLPHILIFPVLQLVFIKSKLISFQTEICKIQAILFIRKLGFHVFPNYANLRYRHFSLGIPNLILVTIL